MALLASCGFPRPPDVGPTDGGDDAPGVIDCALTAIAPGVAHTNDKLHLDGTFVGGVTVKFPGGVTRPAMVLGPHRATVTVPADAGSGELTVSACAATLGPLPFRHVSFSAGLVGFGAIAEQAEFARQTVKLATARERSAAFAAGRYVYIVGGAGDSGALASVEQASTNADGSLTPFASYPQASLAVARQGHTVATLGDQIYVLGGAAAGPLDSIERAMISRDGSLGSFAVVSDAKLAVARSDHASVVVGDSLYVLGGSNGSPLDSVERAPIKADGSLAPFAIVAGVHLATARHGHAAVVIENYLYVLGGTSSGGPLDDIERAPIAADGTLGAFSSVSAARILTPRSGHSALVLGSALYVLGGAGGSGALNSIERAAFDADGLLGAFSALPETMLTARQGHASIVVGDRVYVFGGSGAGMLDSAEWATLILNGDVGTPAVAGITFVVPRSASAAVVIGSYLYMVGGAFTGANTIERATIATDGALSSFNTVDGLGLTTPRRRHAAAVIGKYLYVIGGSGASGPVKSIERAIINPDGSLGSFSDVASLTAPRTDHSTVVIKDSLYVIGGSDGAGLLASVERATINADGSLGSFAIVPGVALKTARQGHRNLVIRNSLYVLGGDTNAVERAAINSDGSLGAFATVNNSLLLNDARFEATGTRVGNVLHVIGGDTSLTTSSGVSERSTIIAGAVTGFAVSSAGAMLRSGHSTVVLGNYLYILGGVDMNGSPLSALSVLLAN